LAQDEPRFVTGVPHNQSAMPLHVVNAGSQFVARHAEHAAPSGAAAQSLMQFWMMQSSRVA
jgi:hypothetical protein